MNSLCIYLIIAVFSCAMAYFMNVLIKKNISEECKYNYNITFIANLILTLIVTFIQINSFSIYQHFVFSGYISFIYAVSLIDIKKQIIPNEIIKVMILYWSFLTIINGIINMDFVIMGKYILKSVVAGVLSFTVFIIVYFISRKGLGGGDVKLAFVMGLFLSLDRIMAAILYGTIICAVYSFIMILLKKKGKKAEIPFSPFLFLGSYIVLLITA